MRIGASDLDVCRMGLGGNVFGWTADEAASHRVLDAYADAGGNLIDTADVYSAWADGNVGGEAETIIGGYADAGAVTTSSSPPRSPPNRTGAGSHPATSAPPWRNP